MTGVLDAALAALAAGACPIRGMTDGSKRPFGNWSEWQDHRPTLDQVQNWFSDGHPALGIVCGEISGRLECLEIEGRAMGLWPQLKERMAQAGLWDLLTGIAGGYSEKSPSKGVHFLYRIGGDGEMPGNTKLASRVVPGVVQVESMIETRGEGGFIMVAPSNGGTHPSGEPWEMLNGGWDTVATITRDQRDALVRICESFDEMPAMVIPPPPRSRAGTQPREGSGWVESALGDWTQANSIEDVLLRNGWQYLEQDGMGTLWRRPGKARGSCSARVNLNSRLHVFSTSTPFIAGQRRATTYDALDVELTYRLGRPPSSDERVATLRAETDQAPSNDFSWVTVTERPAVAPSANQSDADGAPSTAGVQHQEVVTESVANIPPEFWTQRRWLTQIRDAAHSRLRSPDGLLGAYLARYATTIPKTLMLPATVGSEGTFDYISMLVAPSGGGKSSTIALAARLMDNYPPNARFLFDPPIGSGEGLVQAFLRLEKIKIDDQDVWVQRQILDAIHFSVDEGSALTAQNKRDGTTIVPTLCTAWSGGILGSYGAKAETRRELKRYEYRVTAVMGIQTALANHLTALAATGLPQRMMWFSLTDPNLPPPGTVEWPGELDVAYLNPNNWSIRHPIKVHPSIIAEVQAYEHSLVSRSRTVDLLDSQRYMLMLKNAGIFMFIDDRREMSPEDWELARIAVDSSRRMRNTILETANLAARQATDTQTAKLVNQTLASADALKNRALYLGARSMARKVWNSDVALKRKELKEATAGQHRKLATADEMIEYAVARGWIVMLPDGTFGRGDAKPA